MNIQPTSSSASLAGTARAAAHSDSSESGSDATTQAAKQRDLNKTSQSKSISQGEHAHQREGDGRQANRPRVNNSGDNANGDGANSDGANSDTDQLDLSGENQSANETEAPKDPPPGTLDFRA